MAVLAIIHSCDRYWRQVKEFRGKRLPDDAELAGYAWIIEEHGLQLPTPAKLLAISGRHRRHDAGDWQLLPDQYAAAPELGAQLNLALKWEGVDLAVLDALFRLVAGVSIAEIITRTPTGAQTRRLWFLYEWLTGARLEIPDLGRVTAIDVVDHRRQFALTSGELSIRHRVRNNLPGTPTFCPMVRKTAALATLASMDLGAKVRDVIGTVHADVLARAAAFLLLSDSRASYSIEGEAPSADRTQRWAQSIALAGTIELSVEQFEALQRAVIGDARFVALGLRTEGGFVGEHDRDTLAPVPEHISARAADLHSLINGLIAYDERAGRGAMDGVVAAAVEAFGFVYLHPFEDGNGRVHRWLLHHVLAASGVAPPGVVFPISAVMLREIATYRRVLESYSNRLLPCVDWRTTTQGNVEVLNDTARWYRFFDATAHAEFLYSCVETTITRDLPYEVAYLEAYDRFTMQVTAMVDMPKRHLDLLHRFLRQNSGLLSKRARDREFQALTDAEVAQIEALFADTTGQLPSSPTDWRSGAEGDAGG